MRSSDDEEIQQVANVEAFRDLCAEESAALLKQLQQAARERKNTFEGLVNAARVCSLGSMSHAGGWEYGIHRDLSPINPSISDEGFPYTLTHGRSRYEAQEIHRRTDHYHPQRA